MSLRILAVALALGWMPLSLAADEGHSHHHAAGEKLGSVHFPISCGAEARESFDRGLALLHSFGYEESRKSFAAVAESDPKCGIAQWGIAMTYYHPIWAPPNAVELREGRAAAEKAASLGGGSEREEAFIAAIGTFYSDTDKLDHRMRSLAYEKAMAELAARFPEDDEAAIFHALALLGTALPSDKSYANQKRAAEIVSRVMPRRPDHPGIAHYMIHAFDYPELAKLALPAARSYAKIAPSSPHALHMPSHIFTRLGLWEESIASNRESSAAARSLVAKNHPGSTSFDDLHAMDYLEYAYLQTGQYAKAQAIVKEAASAVTFDEINFAAAYALAAIPARYAVERRRWSEAAALAPQPAGFPWEKFPYAEAMTHFAHAVGSARTGDIAGARGEVARLESLHASLSQQPTGSYDWAAQVEAQRLAAAGWLARAEGKDQDAEKLLRAAADLEDSRDKHPVTPGVVWPSREQLADLLFEIGRPADALREYEASLRVAPGRLNSVLGVTRSK